MRVKGDDRLDTHLGQLLKYLGAVQRFIVDTDILASFVQIRHNDRDTARRTAAEALRQAEAQADTERQAMLAHTEEDCQALREAALGRMDGAVAYLLEKVVKR